MISKEAYYSGFEPVLLKILEDVCIDEDSISDAEFEAALNQGLYCAANGLWPKTEDDLYLYDKATLHDHIGDLCALCKSLPKLHQPTEGHGGTISAFDLIVDARKHPELRPEDIHKMVLFANHFANLLTIAGIAKIQFTPYHEQNFFLLVLHPKYEEYVNE